MHWTKSPCNSARAPGWFTYRTDGVPVLLKIPTRGHKWLAKGRTCAPAPDRPWRDLNTHRAVTSRARQLHSSEMLSLLNFTWCSFFGPGESEPCAHWGIFITRLDTILGFRIEKIFYELVGSCFTLLSYSKRPYSTRSIVDTESLMISKHSYILNSRRMKG